MERRRMGGRTLAAALLAVCVVDHAAGWKTKTVDNTDQPMRWSVPVNDTDGTSLDGLGAGLSWAVEPNFGLKMKDLFKENNYRMFGNDFITAESLNDAIQRAMFQWSNNHKYITFFNVTDKCRKEGKGADCSVAEVYIRADTGAEKYGWAPVQVFHELGSSTVKTTAGQEINAKEITHAEVVFYLDHPVEQPDFPRGLQCYYQDETFCEPFQTLQQDFDFKLMIECICFITWALAFLAAIKRVVEYVLAYMSKGWTGLTQVARTHAAHIGYSYFIMLMLIFPPAFYWVAVHPCFLCYSFESLAVGAIGRVLGFEYVNSGEGKNQRSTKRMSDKVCESAHKYTADAAADPFSVLLAPDVRDANYCLTGSDLDGLYNLYPLCEGAKTIAGCMRSKTNLGYLRVLLAFGVPFLVVSLIVFFAVAMLRRVEQKASEDIKKRLAISAFTSAAAQGAADKKKRAPRRFSMAAMSSKKKKPEGGDANGANGASNGNGLVAGRV